MKLFSKLKLGSALVAVGAAIVLAGQSGCSGSGNESGEAAKPLPSVSIKSAQVRSEQLVSTVQIAGTVKAKNTALIAPKVMGTIGAFPVGLGEQVKEGDLLVRIDAAEIAAKVAQAKAQLQQARRDLQREETLLEKGASTSEIVKNLRDRFAVVEAMSEEAQVMLGYTEIRAPFAGSVSRKFSDVGSLASPGMPLLELEGDSDYEIVAGIPESLVKRISIGDRFTANLPAQGSEFTVELVELSTGAESFSRTVTARLSVPDDVVVRTGQYAKVNFAAEPRESLLIPVSSLSRRGQLERVFVVEDGLAKLRLVKSGAKRDGLVEILSGLDAAETVVVEPETGLVDGQGVLN